MLRCIDEDEPMVLNMKLNMISYANAEFSICRYLSNGYRSGVLALKQ